MIGQNNDDPVDEAFEARAAAKLLFRGYVAAVLCGMLYYWPVQSVLAEIIQILLTGLLLYVSCLPLVLASTVIRNAVCRRFSLKLSKQMAIGLGILILLIVLVIAAKAFGLGRLFLMID
jgi:hypothetical protein